MLQNRAKRKLYRADDFQGERKDICAVLVLIKGEIDMSKIIVNMPIQVPSGIYCWEFHGDREICEHFDNTGGHATCSLGFDIFNKDLHNGVEKPRECMLLKERL